MLPLLLAACLPLGPGVDSGDVTDDTGVPDDTGDSGVDEVEVLELEVAATAKPTVFRVSFDAPAGFQARVEYGTGGSLDHAVAAEEIAPGRYALTLLGLAADVSWSARATVEVDGELQVSPAVELPRANAPTWLPDLKVSVGTRAPTGGFWLLTHALPGAGGVSLIDDEGRYVWWEQGAPDPGAMVMSASLTEDGTAVEWLELGTSAQGDVIHHSPLDGSTGYTVRVHDAHHDFVAPEGERWVALADEIRDVDGQAIVGDKLVEFDRDGHERVIWSSWDWLEPNPDSGLVSGPDGLWWTHANGVWLDETSGRYFVSLYGISSVVVIDSATGEMEAVIGGDDGTTTVQGGPEFRHQHAPLVFGDHLLVFDNGEYISTETVSTVREYQVSPDLGVATQVWAYPNPDGAYVPNFGNAVRRADGGSFISWGSLGRIDEIAADGSVRWQLDSSLGSPFGYVRPIGQLGGALR